MPGTSLFHNGKWKLRAAIFLALIGPLYVVPSLLRALLLGRAAWLLGILVADVAGSLVIGFLTNSYRFAAAMYVAATASELLLALAGQRPAVALWLGDLIPACVAIYYVQQIYINMGD